MLDRRHRLVSSAGFSSATRRGRRAGTRTLVLHLAGSPTAVTAPMTGTAPGSERGAEPQVGFAVGTAVGNAVVRNRVRRRLRHLLRDRVGFVPNGSVLVVRALPPAAVATYDALRRDVDGALRRLGVAVGSGTGR